MARKTKASTYVRLLEEGDKFYSNDYVDVYLVKRVEVNDETGMVKVFVQGRHRAFVFGINDRVNLCNH
ncbi:hypothetical protein MADRUGA_67 [Mycobacterium phage Madruga]|uniref:Uncharacterized protein n=1 Tax=Mycobacterium phage Madruga TaxID=1675552 RepID=A0A0K1LS28_9CAUD|nr:hypothetical protein MADRUGA_67 [Mycobacterium phage Madruga]